MGRSLQQQRCSWLKLGLIWALGPGGLPFYGGGLGSAIAQDSSEVFFADVLVRGQPVFQVGGSSMLARLTGPGKLTAALPPCSIKMLGVVDIASQPIPDGADRPHDEP
jgi:hypothetical protein